MGTLNIEGLKVSPLKIIPGELGNIYHALKASGQGFNGFGEAYFSSIHFDKIKGWKLHQRLTMNIVVITGSIKFVVCDLREKNAQSPIITEMILSRENYQRLTVPPQVWMSFKGLETGENILLNIADLEHDPEESLQLPLKNDLIPYAWADQS